MDNPIRYEDKKGDTPGGGDDNIIRNKPPIEGGNGAGGGGGGAFVRVRATSPPVGKLTLEKPIVASKSTEPWYAKIAAKGEIGKKNGTDYAKEQAGGKVQNEVKTTTDNGTESHNDVVYQNGEGKNIIQENKFVGKPDKIATPQDARNILSTQQRATVDQLHATGSLNFHGPNAGDLQNKSAPVAQYNVAISDNTQVVKVYQLFPEQKQIYPK